MPNYRRARVPGGTYFFTLTLHDRRSRLLVQRIACLRRALLVAKAARPWRLDAIVVLPEHLHMVCTLPPGDCDYAARLAHFKGLFVRQLPVAEQSRCGRKNRRERGVWQPRYWEHAIRDDRDLQAHVDYVHFNPVKHGYAHRVADWPWSSFHRYVRQDVLSADWGVAPRAPVFSGEG